MAPPRPIYGAFHGGVLCGCVAVWFWGPGELPGGLLGLPGWIGPCIRSAFPGRWCKVGDVGRPKPAGTVLLAGQIQR
jgi:hypothetical protein